MSLITIGGIALIIIVGNALCILADYRLAGPSVRRQQSFTVEAEREWRGEPKQHTQQELNQAVSDAQADIMARYMIEKTSAHL